MYDRALANENYEREINHMVDMINLSGRVYFSELLHVPVPQQTLNYMHEYMVIQAIARSGCKVMHDRDNFIRSVRKKEEYEKENRPTGYGATVIMDAKITNEGKHSIVPFPGCQ